MQSRRERLLDVTFRLSCRECGRYRFARLGCEKRERAEAGEDVIEFCGFCGRLERHEVVAP